MTAWCGTDNGRSQKALERLGFVHEGVLRRWHVHAGEPKDVISYSMLRSEWEASDLADEPFEIVGESRCSSSLRTRNPSPCRGASPPAKRAAPAGRLHHLAAATSSSRSPSASGRPAPSIVARRSASIVSCGKPGEPLGQLERPLDVLSRRHDLVHEPDAQRLVGSPPGGPVRISSSARPIPTTRGSRCVPPSISGTPQRRSNRPNVEPSVAIRRSHHSASSTPPARHQPEIAAIVGFDGVETREAHRAVGVSRSRGVHRLQVGARAERDVGAGQHQHARVVVRLEALKPLAQQLRRLAVDGVAALRAVDREHRRLADRS